MTTVLHGHEAIEYYMAHWDSRLCKYADPVEDAREDLSLEEAQAIARVDPRLIYVEVGQ